MSRLLIRGIAIAAIAALSVASPVAVASPESSDAGKRSCNTINLGGPRVFTKHNMRCEKAKQKATRVYKTNGAHEPRNFSCTSGSNFEEGGFCEHVSEDKYFGWHPGD